MPDDNPPILSPDLESAEAKRARVLVTDEECRAIALARLRPFADECNKLRLPTWEELAPRFHDRDPPVLRHAMERAFCQRLVRAITLPKPPIECPQNQALEIELRDTYRKLRSAIVLDTDPVFHTLQGSDPQADDEVHRVLGHAMARIIAQGLIFDDGNVIGLGAGRGVYHTVDALSTHEPQHLNGITVVSLTGSVQVRDYMTQVALHMDADTHGLILMKCFNAAQIRFISASICQADEKELLRVRNQTVLRADSWEKLKPTHALVGIGVLAPGHRFLRGGAEPRKSGLPPAYTNAPRSVGQNL